MPRRFEQAAVNRFVRLARQAYAIAGWPPIRITSWHRTLAHAISHGEPNSQHVVLTAIDTAPPNRDWRRAAEQVGLTVIFEGSHDHTQLYRRGEGPHL